MTYSTNQSFNLYVDGKLCPKKYKTQFSFLSERNIINSFVVGASCSGININKESFVFPKDPVHLSKIHMQNNFIGQIKKFNVIKHEFTEEEVVKYDKWCRALHDPDKDKTPPKIEEQKQTLFGSKKEYPLDVMIENDTIINLNVIIAGLNSGVFLQDRTKKNNNFTNNHSGSKKRRTSKQIRKISIESIDEVDRKWDIFTQGISYMEKSRFEDILFSVGNVDIFFLCIESLTNFENLDSELSHKIVGDIILALNASTNCQNKNDPLDFLEKKGFDMLALVIKEVIYLN